MNNPNYQIIIRDKQGNVLGEFTEWFSLNFSDRLNNYGTCEFSVPVTSLELARLVSMRRYETIIRRNGVDVWWGEQANRYGELTANSANLVTIVSHGFFEMFNSMYSPLIVRYEQIDEGAILKDLLDTFQLKDNGDFGFTFGDYLTGTLRDREYTNYNLMDAWTNMSNVVNGPDFYIDKDKTITIVKRLGVDRSKNTILEWGVNVQNVSVNEDFSTPCNESILLGAGFGSEQLVSVVTDTKMGQIYGLRQQSASESDVSIQSTLDIKAQSLVKKYKQPLSTLNVNMMPTVDPQFGTIKLGDSVRVRVQEGIFNINVIYRNYGYNVEVDENGVESVSYLLGSI